jgi:hypothetical protein
VEAITEDVSFRAPRIAVHLDAVWPHLPALLARIDAHTAGIGVLADGLPETRVQRSRGRDLADWEGLLDDGTLLARLVLRGIALSQGTVFPTDEPGRRALWRRASVTPDEVSSTVLTYGLRPTGVTWQETALRE